MDYVLDKITQAGFRAGMLDQLEAQMVKVSNQ